MKVDNKGFTIIEIIFTMTIILIIIIPLFRFMETFNNIWKQLQLKIDLQEQARIISVNLERDMKEAVDIKTEDTDNDGVNELYLNLGENVSKNDNTDINTNYYIQYKVKNKTLYYSIPYSDFNESGTNYPLWPEDSIWGYSRPVTLNIIKDFTITMLEDNLIYFNFILQKENQEYDFENIISPVLYSEFRN